LFFILQVQRKTERQGNKQPGHLESIQVLTNTKLHPLCNRGRKK